MQPPVPGKDNEMLSFFDDIRDVSLFSVIIRMFFAFSCGAAIGMERSYKNRPAGFRTHILVCLGAAIVSTTGIYLAVNRQFPTDLSRLGAQVVSGLGFIGGGTIILTGKKKIKGLTTAAGLWATGIIGLAIGAGFYEGAVIAAVLVIFVEIVLFDFGSRIKHLPEFHMQLTYTKKAALDDVLRCCKDQQFSIHNLQVTGKSGDEQPVYSAVISLRSRKFATAEMLVAFAEKCDGVVAVETTDL